MLFSLLVLIFTAFSVVHADTEVEGVTQPSEEEPTSKLKSLTNRARKYFGKRFPIDPNGSKNSLQRLYDTSSQTLQRTMKSVGGPSNGEELKALLGKMSPKAVKALGGAGAAMVAYALANPGHSAALLSDVFQNGLPGALVRHAPNVITNSLQMTKMEKDSITSSNFKGAKDRAPYLEELDDEEDLNAILPEEYEDELPVLPTKAKPHLIK